MKPEVTVVIPSYNPGNYLRDALRSVISQTYKNWKLIIVDDASTDQSLFTIRQYLTDPRIKLIRNVYNLGQSKSLNIGLEAAESSYLIQLDADDWLVPHTLEVLVEEAEKQPKDVAVISGNIRIVIEHPLPHEISKSFVKKGRFFKDKYDFMLSNLSLWPRFYRREALLDIGGWPTDDPFQGRYMEDKRVLFRLAEKYRFHWIDQILYVHRRHLYNQTEKKEAYAAITEWNVLDALKRWGDEFEPEFEIDEWGWKYVVGLNPKKGVN